MKKIERIFRNSNNSDEIFDAFTEAVKEKIDDVNLYNNQTKAGEFVASDGSIRQAGIVDGEDSNFKI